MTCQRTNDFRLGAGWPWQSLPTEAEWPTPRTTSSIYANLDETTALPIPGTDERPRNPFFSPDGEWIGYWASDQLKKIAVGGGVPVPLADVGVPRDAVWGEDDTIVFGLEEGVMRVSANGGTPERLIAGDDIDIGGPSMLPDGETVLFGTRGDGGDLQIVVQPLGSGERKVLLEGDRARYVSTGHLVYGRDGALFAVPFDLDALELVGGPVPLVEGVLGPSRMHHYAISNTGTLVYVAAFGTVAERRVLARAGREGETELLDLPPAEYLSPRLSRARVLPRRPVDGLRLWGSVAPLRRFHPLPAKTNSILLTDPS